MTEAKMFLDALAKLDSLYALGQVNFFEWSTRKHLLIEEIDKARTPVADKALSLWLENGYGEYWLNLVEGDAILAAARVPTWVLDNGRLYISSAAIDSSKFTIRTKASDSGKLYAAGMGFGVEAQEVLAKMGDCITRTSLGEGLKAEIDKIDARGGHTINMTVNVDGNSIASEIKGAVERGISEAIYPLREGCADAAQWLVMNGVEVGCGKIKAAEWLDMRDIHKATWIICTARKYLDELNAKRQPVAHAALILWTVFGARADSLFQTCPVDLLSKFDNERAFHADKARDVYFKRVGVPSYIQGQMMVMGWDWIESEWLSLQGPKRCGTRITVNRLGTPAAGAEVRVNFYKDGEPVSSHLISGKVSESKYCRHVWVCDYDEYRVIGDACVSVEAIYESR